VKRVIAIAVALSVAAPAVADAAALHVAPSSVPAGDVVRVFGSVGGGCARGDSVTLFSRAFNPRHEFAGVPAIFARAGRNSSSAAWSVRPAALLPRARSHGQGRPTTSAAGKPDRRVKAALTYSTVSGESAAPPNSAISTASGARS